MPSILDAADAFSKLGKKSVLIHEASCVRVRHRRASCDACLRACPHDAITIEENRLSVTASQCTGCGACATVCPTEALTLIDEPIETVLVAIDGTKPHTALTVMCACARNSGVIETGSILDASAEHSVTPTRSSEENTLIVPCLSALDESVLIHAACTQVPLIYLSADCSQCPNANGTLIGDVIEQARVLLAGSSDCFLSSQESSKEDRGDEGLVLDLSWSQIEFEKGARTEDTSKEYSRRDMFDHLVAKTTDSVAEAAVGTFYVTSSAKHDEPSLAQNLMMQNGEMKRADVERNARILNDLYRACESAGTDVPMCPENTVIPTRLFGRIDVEKDTCTLCGICMKFCPTGALDGTPAPVVNHFVSLTRDVEPNGELTFRANDCVACRLCVDVCPRGALSMQRGIAPEDLFALEPRMLISRG